MMHRITEWLVELLLWIVHCKVMPEGLATTPKASGRPLSMKAGIAELSVRLTEEGYLRTARKTKRPRNTRVCVPAESHRDDSKEAEERRPSELNIDTMENSQEADRTSHIRSLDVSCPVRGRTAIRGLGGQDGNTKSYSGTIVKCYGYTNLTDSEEANESDGEEDNIELEEDVAATDNNTGQGSNGKMSRQVGHINAKRAMFKSSEDVGNSTHEGRKRAKFNESINEQMVSPPGDAVLPSSPATVLGLPEDTSPAEGSPSVRMDTPMMSRCSGSPSLTAQQPISTYPLPSTSFRFTNDQCERTLLLAKKAPSSTYAIPIGLVECLTYMDHFPGKNLDSTRTRRTRGAGRVLSHQIRDP